jgi:ACS family 4-hydroxyphenylacetate permease-like MFS transporter
VASGSCTQLQSDLSLEERAIRKAFRRLVPFLFLLFVVSFLDRINISFAALSMNRDLKLTATMFGLANTCFYIGYALCEIPSNLMLAKVGARKWMARILVTWGLASAVNMLAVGAHSLYTLRLIVGIAEAGFLPGIFLYLTYWFPPTYRARATGLVLIAQPVTIAIASPISGLILDHMNGLFGLAGWRWLFLLEGGPAVLLGIITVFYLTDSPTKAKWLTDSEKAALENRLQREQRSPEVQSVRGSAWRGAFNRNVLLLAMAYFSLVVGLNTNTTWTPQIVREVMKAHSFSSVGLFTAIPAACALVAMLIWGARSDRRMERTWHFVMPMALAALGWLLVAVAKMPELRMLGLIFGCSGVLTAMTIFWTIPPHVLSSAGRPVGLAFINSCGMIAAASSPLIVGFFRDLTHSWAASLIFVAVMMVISATLVLLVPAKEAIAHKVS